MKNKFLDRLIDRLGRVDPGSLQLQILHLAREKGLLETIFHSMQEGLVVLDARGRIEFANRAAERLLGFSMEEAHGTRIGRYLREVDWEQVLSLDAAEWSRLLSREIEVNYPEHRFLAFYVVPLRRDSADGAPPSSGAVLILRDVTRERENAAQSLESERLRAVTLLAAGVAHEIGNPLNSLHIHLQLIERAIARPGGATAQELAELVRVARTEVERLDRIITEFLQAVRPVKPQLESADFGELLRDALAFLGPELSDRRILVETEIPPDLPTARVDRGQIRQLLFNVIKNAAEAMSGGGVLRVTVGATDRFLRCTIRDTGHGMTAEQMSRIFDPYYTTKPGGTGLGMMIVQRIVRDHGGEIEIHSEPGGGTAVTVYLPREDRLIPVSYTHL
ncbi:MAG: ATP-binding protein, partial [Kiritimatiellae bacterium]|nr:ATP-binding protein [Kiritimatiellia bacterium]